MAIETAITFGSVSFTGTPNDYDKRAATMIVEIENTRRAADVDENGDAILPPLAYATATQLKASYLLLLKQIITNAHLSYIEQASKVDGDASVKALWKDATDAQRAAAVAALQA